MGCIMEIKKDEDKINMELSDEELKNMLQDLLSFSPTIEEAIAEKQEQDKRMKDSFDIIKKTCSTIINYSNLAIIKINKMILKGYVLKLSDSFFNDIIVKLQNSKNDIKIQLVLLKEVKKTILILEKHKVITCNLEISKLMGFIFEKENLILNELANQMNILRLDIEGIDCQLSNKNQEELKELDENINNSIKTLGLKNNAFSDNKK